MKTVRLGCTDIGAILFAGIDDDNNLCSTYISVGGDGEFTGLLTRLKYRQHMTICLPVIIG